VLVVEVVKMFIKLIMPPITGRIPVGSGELRSVNHQKPSFRMAGLML
jgi:hypothetical protein